jgi:hypothetical protein
MDIPIEYYTERGREVPGPSWTADELACMDDDDIAAVRAAMENSAAERVAADNRRLEWEITRLQDMLAANGIDYEEDAP